MTARSSKLHVHRVLPKLGYLARLGSIIRGHRYVPSATGGMVSATIAVVSSPARHSRTRQKRAASVESPMAVKKVASAIIYPIPFAKPAEKQTKNKPSLVAGSVYLPGLCCCRQIERPITM